MPRWAWCSCINQLVASPNPLCLLKYAASLATVSSDRFDLPLYQFQRHGWGICDFTATRFSGWPVFFTNFFSALSNTLPALVTIYALPRFTTTSLLRL